jgi:NADH dehydrogenase
VNSIDKRVTVLVDGATGYVGSHLVYQLTRKNYIVRCLVHSGATLEDIELLRSWGAEIYTGDLTGASELTRAFRDVDTVVHLIGTIAPKRGENLETLHQGQTAVLANCALAARVNKIVMVTALGAAKDAPSIYHRTKWQAEQALVKSGIPNIILRPSLLIGRIIGRRNSKLVDRFSKLILSKKKVPLINNGKNQIQPLYIGDLVSVLTECVGNTSGNLIGGSYELGGSQTMTMRQFIEKLMNCYKQVKPFVNISPVVAQLAASFCELIERVPTISRDQVKLSLSDNVCVNNALTTVFGVQPTSVEEALKSYTKNGATVQAGK